MNAVPKVINAQAVNISKKILNEAFQTNPASIAEARERIIVLIQHEVQELLDYNQQLHDGFREADNSAQRLSQVLAGAQEYLTSITGPHNYSTLIEHIKQAIEKSKSAAEPSQVHHHWYTPTEVEQQGDVMVARPSSVKWSDTDVKIKTIELVTKDRVSVDKLVELLESDAFSKVSAKLQGNEVEEPKTYNVGPLTGEHVFKRFGIENVSDLQRVLDGVEAVLLHAQMTK